MSYPSRSSELHFSFFNPGLMTTMKGNRNAASVTYNHLARKSALFRRHSLFARSLNHLKRIGIDSLSSLARSAVSSQTADEYDLRQGREAVQYVRWQQDTAAKVLADSDVFDEQARVVESTLVRHQTMRMFQQVTYMLQRSYTMPFGMRWLHANTEDFDEVSTRLCSSFAICVSFVAPELCLCCLL